MNECGVCLLMWMICHGDQLFVPHALLLHGQFPHGLRVPHLGFVVILDLAQAVVVATSKLSNARYPGLLLLGIFSSECLHYSRHRLGGPLLFPPALPDTRWAQQLSVVVVEVVHGAVGGRGHGSVVVVGSRSWRQI